MRAVVEGFLRSSDAATGPNARTRYGWAVRQIDGKSASLSTVEPVPTADRCSWQSVSPRGRVGSTIDIPSSICAVHGIGRVRPRRCRRAIGGGPRAPGLLPISDPFPHVTDHVFGTKARPTSRTVARISQARTHGVARARGSVTCPRIDGSINGRLPLPVGAKMLAGVDAHLCRLKPRHVYDWNN